MKIIKNNFLLKVFYSIPMLSLFSVFLLLSSCSDANKTNAIIKSISEVEPKTDAGKTYQKFMVTTLEFAEKSAELLAKYDIGMPSDEEVASVEEPNGGFLDIENVISSLPEDLSTITRKRTTETDVDGVMVISEEEVTLKDEMVELETEFAEIVKEIQPDITDATTLGFVSRVDNNTIQIGGDMVLRNDDISGAISIELLNAEARGEDADAILADMGIITAALNENSEDVEELENDEGVDPTGNFQNTTNRWKFNGRIYYVIRSNVPAHVRSALITGMEDWERTTKGIIDFRPCNHSGIPFWSMFYGSSCVSIEMKNITAPGSATVGYKPGSFGKLNISISQYSDPNNYYSKNELQATIKHELGHTIGLQHEHQRPDRDLFVKVSAEDNKDNTNYGKLFDKFYYNQLQIKWSRKRVKIWFITFYIYYPEFYTVKKTVQVNQRTVNYDYFSIMQYSGLYTRNTHNMLDSNRCTDIYTNTYNIYDTTKKCMPKSSTMTKYNKYITKKDTSAVKKMYRGSW